MTARDPGPPLVTATALAALAGAVGCGPAEIEDTGSSYTAIVFGQESGPEDDAVVLVNAKDSRGVTSNCSGTLVAPNLLLTARHCVSSYVDGVFTCSTDGELEDAVGRAGAMGDLVPPENIRVREGMVPAAAEVALGKEIVALSTPSICRNDIALVVLDRDTDLPVATLRLTTAIRHDERMRAVGYGLDENGDILARRSRDDVAVTAIGPSDYWPEEGLAPPRTFALGPSACQGDSGGPAFTEREAVAGVYSLSAGECVAPTVRNYFTQIAPFEDLVREAFQKAGAEPLVEPEGGVVGSTTRAGAGGDAGAADAGSGDAGSGPTGALGGALPSDAARGGAAGSAELVEPGAVAGVGGSGPAPHGDAGARAIGGRGHDAAVAGLAGSVENEGAADDAAASGAAPNYHGPRKEGGCRCGLVGAGSPGSRYTVAVLMGVLGAWSRKRR